MKRRIVLFLLIPILMMAVELNEGRTIWTQDQGFFTKYRQIEVRALDVGGKAIIWGKENEFPTRELTFDPYNHYLITNFEGFDATIQEYLISGPEYLAIKDRLDTTWVGIIIDGDTIQLKSGVNNFSRSWGVGGFYLIAATEKGVYESIDGGSNWSEVQPQIGTKYSSFTFDAVISPIIQTSTTPNMRRYFAAATDGVYSKTGFFIDGWKVLPRIVEDQDFEDADPNNLDSLPPGWTQTGVEDNYKYVRLDTLISYSGDYSLLIHSSAVGGADVAARYGLPDLDRLVCGFQFMPSYHSGVIEIKSGCEYISHNMRDTTFPELKVAYRYGKMSYYTPEDGWVEIDNSGVNMGMFNELKVALDIENEIGILYTPTSVDTLNLYDAEDTVPEVVFSTEAFGSGSQPYWIDDFYAQPKVSALAGHPDSIEYVYAGTPLGIYSYDGNEWALKLDVEDVWFKLETCLMGDYMVAASDSLVYISGDQGVNWDNITGDIPSINDIHVDTDSVVYAATDNFVYKYDGSWTQLDTVSFLEHGVIEQVKVCEAITMMGPDTILVGNHNGIYVSVDGGNNWVENNEGIEPYPIGSALVAEVDDYFEDAVPSDSTTGLIDLLTQGIGPIPDVDNDGLLHVVLLDIYEDPVASDEVSAYFDVYNEYDEEEVPSGVKTNEMEIIYADVDDEVGWNSDPADVKDEIARGLTQMIEWYYDPVEILPTPKEWIINGYEEYGVYLANLGADSVVPEGTFSTEDLTYKLIPQTDLVYLFIQYLRGKFTDDILYDLNLAQVVKIDPQTGLPDTIKLQCIEAIDHILVNRTPGSFVDAFEDWSISCYIDSLTYVKDVVFTAETISVNEEVEQPRYSAKAWRITDTLNPLVFSGNDNNDFHLHIVEYDGGNFTVVPVEDSGFSEPGRNLHVIDLDVDSFDLLVEVISSTNAFYNLSLDQTVDTIDMISILQSPLADRFIRIYYYTGTTRLLDAGVEGGYVMVEEETSKLSLMTASSLEGYRIYYGDIVLPTVDGTMPLIFSSEDISGNQYIDTVDITVKSIGVEGGYIASSDNSFRVDIPRDALDKSYHVTACNTGNSYYVGPGVSLDVKAVLTVDVSGRESEDLSIYRKEGDNWIEIPCVRRGNKIEAEIGTLGEFKVMEGNLVTDIPVTLELSTNTLNPFEIRYAIPEKGKVRIDVYNALGQRIKSLVNSVVNPGFYAARWDARADNGVMVGNGIYFYRLSVTGESITKKIVLVR